MNLLNMISMLSNLNHDILKELIELNQQIGDLKREIEKLIHQNEILTNRKFELEKMLEIISGVKY